MWVKAINLFCSGFLASSCLHALSEHAWGQCGMFGAISALNIYAWARL